jgi:predicted dehydrogenase
MIVAKCCHDTDIIAWLIGKQCRSVSSYGALTYFIEKNAPEGAPERCTDGCPHADSCYYNALRYTSDMREPWLEVVYDNYKDATAEEIVEWLKSSDYGRCVFRCDNDVVDHQTVAMEFEDDITANLTMTAFETGRYIEIFGTEGVLKGGYFTKKTTGKDIIVHRWDGQHKEYTVTEDTTEDHHMGGDSGIMEALHDEMTGKGNPVSSYIQSHIMAYAAEESRISDKKIEIQQFEIDMAGK